MANDSWLQVLNGKFSKQWVQCLRQLSSCGVFPFQADRMLRDGCGEGDSWEQLLRSFVENTATSEAGELKVVPLFLTLPPRLQARILFLLLMHLERVSSAALSDFVRRVKEHCTKSSWTEYLMRQLQAKVVDNLKSCGAEGQGENSVSVAYEFYNQSQFTDVLKRLKSPSQYCASLTVPGKQMEPGGKSESQGQEYEVDSLRQNGSKSLTNQDKLENRSAHRLENVVDVIVIEDDEDGSCDDDHFVSSQPFNEEKAGNKAGPAKEKTKKRLFSDATGGDTLCESKNAQKRVRLGGDLEDEITTGTSLSVDGTETTKALSSVEDNNGDEKNSEKEKETVSEETPCDDGDYILSDASKNFLEPFRDALSSKDVQDTAVLSDVWTHLQSLTSVQVRAACDFLGLKDLNEETVVTLCDNIPWTSLGYDTLLNLLEGFLIHKVRHLSSQPSHALVDVAKSIAKYHPKVLLEVLTDVICEANSGLPQCQLLISLCQHCLTSDLAGFLLRQVSSKDVKVTENVVSVLQAVVDQRPELMPDTLQNILDLLRESGAECATNQKFGKLLLSFTNKYGKKLTGEQVASLSVVVGENKSSLKRALVAALKRLSR
ncbi:uncharacterized protein LOC101845868 [Aplysia californica]|uniref:Uncharacterized protein LOC101845868 n=1 Tax=Aplysia californica TaxID=6500 RepID=A0ABM0K151_APLCA|nr:uncharacterized protein LOC101845868 [Aplysia californica]XP_005106310.1 uncharacterized protein LOC101845868 [Aplysia californica]XP_035827749.1 uncharacterized protein LOC101845868 [Aplysia californica]